jgi:hypothetical protein
VSWSRRHRAAVQCRQADACGEAGNHAPAKSFHSPQQGREAMYFGIGGLILLIIILIILFR